MISYNFWFISYRLRVISICLWTENDVMLLSRLGGIVGQMSKRILKGSPDFLFAINYNFWSISYRFRVISICLWTGNDVMQISPLGGVAGQILRRILKGVPDFLFAINYDCWSISYHFIVISVYLWTRNDVMPIFPLGGVQI